MRHVDPMLLTDFVPVMQPPTPGRILHAFADYIERIPTGDWNMGDSMSCAMAHAGRLGLVSKKERRYINPLSQPHPNGCGCSHCLDYSKNQLGLSSDELESIYHARGLPNGTRRTVADRLRALADRL